MIWESSHKLMRGEVLLRTLHFTLIFFIASMFSAAFANASTHAYSWTKTMGGTDYDGGRSVAVDGSGNVYVTGFFSGTVDFDPGAGTDNHTSAGYSDIFLTKINSDGTYGWTKTMGSASNHDYGYSVAVDGSGNVYVTGFFWGTVDFDTGAEIDSHTSAGISDIFLTKINSDGTYGWTKTMGGLSDESGYSVAVDGSGNIYVTGYFSGTADFDPGAGFDNHTSAVKDIFLTKINSDGSYGWTKTMGGSDEYGYSVAVDGSGNVYVTGTFEGTADFDPGVATDNHTSAGGLDIFLTRINSDGSYGWTKTMGGTDSAGYGRSVAVDGSEDVYVTGYFTGTVDFDPGVATDNHTSAGGADIFLTRINSDGTYGWTKTMGGGLNENSFSVAVDGSGNVYITGNFRGTVDFDPGAGADNHTSAGYHDIFLTRINSDGTYGWTKTMGGTDSDWGYSVAVDGSGDIYVTGEFYGTADFDPGAVTDNHTSAGGYDIFLTKFSFSSYHDFNGDGNADILGVNSAGMIWWYDIFGDTWHNVAGSLADMVTGDFNGDMISDIAGLNASGQIWWYDVDGAAWHNISGSLASVVAGDFNGDGNDDIVGLNASGQIWWYDIESTAWHNISGSLASLVAGDFNGDGNDDIAGLNASGKIWWYDVDGATWHNISGTLVSLETGDFNGDSNDDIAGLNASGQIWWYDMEGTAWHNIPGSLASFEVGEFNGDGIDDLAGLNASGQIWWYDVEGAAWHNIPGTLMKIIVDDYDGDGYDDIAGLNSSGMIWYTTDLSTWQNIPGSLEELY
jgi:hypothetical protein